MLESLMVEVVVCAFIPSAQEAEAEGSLSWSIRKFRSCVSLIDAEVRDERCN